MEYFLREIDPKFWQKVKRKAGAEKKTVKQVILSLLWHWVEDIKPLKGKR